MVVKATLGAIVLGTVKPKDVNVSKRKSNVTANATIKDPVQTKIEH